jgi:hypothetical protein
MLYYLAGSLDPKIFERTADRALTISGRANHFLFSFANPLACDCAHHFCLQPQRRIFVDSGAFTAWRERREINLTDYIDFCKKIKRKAKCKDLVFAALDVIPGTPDRMPTEDEKKKACDRGWDNYQTMKEEGIRCIMTFHQFEHTSQLKRIMDDYGSFAVSIRKDPAIPPETKLTWLKNIFRECGYSDTAENSVVKWKIHGLGVSSLDFMRHVPFFSVDSTDAIKAGNHFQLHQFGGNGIRRRTRGAWERLALEDGIPIRYVGKMLGFDPDGLSEANGQSGSYWLQTRAMEACVETELYLTELWRSKGVDWDDQKDIMRARTPEHGPPMGEEERRELVAKDARWFAAAEKQTKDPETRRWLGLAEKKSQSKS